MTKEDFDFLLSNITFKSKVNDNMTFLLENAYYALVFKDNIVGFTTIENPEPGTIINNPWGKELIIAEVDNKLDRIYLEI